MRRRSGFRIGRLLTFIGARIVGSRTGLCMKRTGRVIPGRGPRPNRDKILRPKHQDRIPPGHLHSIVHCLGNRAENEEVCQPAVEQEGDDESRRLPPRRTENERHRLVLQGPFSDWPVDQLQAEDP